MGSRATRIILAASAALLTAGCPDSVSDFDGDGTVDEADCAPEDPAIHPGADDDTVDGIDQDCDGVDGPSGDDDDAADDDAADDDLSDDDAADDDLSDDDAADDDSGDDDTAGDDDVTPGALSRLCAGAHHATGGGYAIESCTGPVELGAGVATDGHWTVTVDALRWTGGGSR